MIHGSVINAGASLASAKTVVNVVAAPLVGARATVNAVAVALVATTTVSNPDGAYRLRRRVRVD